MGTGTSEHRHTVLLVDDHEDLRDAFLVLALSSGVDAVAVAGGREALTYLKTAAATPCVIVLDLSMPDMDGLAFRREQSADPALADIPVVVLSGAGPGMEAEARRLGRFFTHGATQGKFTFLSPTDNVDFPFTLDLRNA